MTDLDVDGNSPISLALRWGHHGYIIFYFYICVYVLHSILTFIHYMFMCAFIEY